MIIELETTNMYQCSWPVEEWTEPLAQNGTKDRREESQADQLISPHLHQLWEVEHSAQQSQRWSPVASIYQLSSLFREEKDCF